RASLLGGVQQHHHLLRQRPERIDALRGTEQIEQHEGEREHDRDDDDHHQHGDLDAQRVHGAASCTSTLAASWYPPLRTVLNSCAAPLSASLRRSRLTSTSIERSSTSPSRPRVRSSSWSRDRTRPGRSRNVLSRSNSAPVSSTGAPLGSVTRRACGSATNPSKR